MHWSKYLIVVIGVSFVLITIKNVLDVLSLWSLPSSFAVLKDPGKMGVYDPSIEYAEGDDRGVLAYTSISSDPDIIYPTSDINIARSGARSSKWYFNSTVFEAKQDSFFDRYGRGEEIPGVWRYEMPSIIYVPEDVGAEWKIYAYRYFWAENVNVARQSGVIVYRETGDINARKWSEEKWLFSANQYNPPPPYNNVVLLHLNILSPSLKRVAAYSDPAAHYKDGVIYMTLSAFETSVETPDRVVMIASNDMGKSWSYVGNVFNLSDVRSYGDYTKFSGGQIFEFDGKSYFSISLGDDLQEGKGSFIFEFSDLSKAALRKDQAGNPVLVNHFDLDLEVEDISPLGGGQGDYHENGAGYLMPVMVNPEADKPFTIQSRGHEIIPEE